MDKSLCTICCDFLTCENCTAIPCGHTFHSQCLYKWKEQSSTCPQCRLRFKEPFKLYFELSREDKAEADPAELRNEVTELKLKIRVRDSSIDTLTKEKKSIEKENKSREQEVKTQQHLLDSALGTNDALKKQLTYMEKFKNDVKRGRSEVALLQNKVESYRNIQQLIDSESHDIEMTIRNFAENPDSFNQISTSYVFFKKEYDRLKESKRVQESENKSYRKKAEAYAQQLKALTNDLRQLDDQNKSLSQKVLELEKSRSNTTAIKRSCQSPKMKDVKRQCISDNEEEDSLVRLDDGRTDDNDSGNYEGNTQDLNLDDEESIKIADEFGLHYVATTSVGPDRKPLKDITKFNKNSFGSKLKHSSASQSTKLHVQQQQHSENYSDLPHFKRGFNGMGGQSKTLVIPKRTGTFMKPSADKKGTSSFTKIPKNNLKITKFVTQRSCSTVDLT